MNYMEWALSLARLALGHTSPNPAVGAVIVKDGVIVGEGHTQPPGSYHAEIMALRQADHLAKDAIMYVTLEPCCHFGRTPPCTQSIVTAGISEVHIATLDPNPLVCGRGKAELEAAGIRTFLGEGEVHAQEINEAYFKFITTGLPFITTEFAISPNGEIIASDSSSRWLSSETSRQYIHHLRYTTDAIMIAANTIVAGNPWFPVRTNGQEREIKRQPLWVVVDSRGNTSPEAQIQRLSGKTLVVTVAPLEPTTQRALVRAEVEVLGIPQENNRLDLGELVRELGKRQITSVLVEDGGVLLSSLLEGGMVDKVVVLIAPLFIDGEEVSASIEDKGVNLVTGLIPLEQAKVERLATDMVVTGYINIMPPPHFESLS